MLDAAKLKARIDEEYKDAEVYREMAAACPEWRQVLNDIACEEMQHAEMLEHIHHSIH